MEQASPPAKRFRLRLLLSGLAGLLAGGLLTAVAIRLVTGGIISILMPHPVMAVLLAVILGAFSLAEIPMMVYAMRRLVVERRGNYGVVLGLNALFVFFAAIYGIPVLLLTGGLGWGLTLCSLGGVRFVASLLFVHEACGPSDPK
jgi:hypothetical protein